MHRRGTTTWNGHFLLRFQECIGCRDTDHHVPLHYAAEFADADTLRHVLDIDTSLVDAQNAHGFTPLLVSVMSGNITATEALLERGAQVAHVDYDKHSAVHWAVVCGQVRFRTAD